MKIHPLANSQERQYIDDQLALASEAETGDEADRIADSIAELPGIKLITPSNYRKENGQSGCDHYVFGVQRRDTWYPGQDLDLGTRAFKLLGLWRQTDHTLVKNGLHPAGGSPELEDVIVYFRDAYPREALHFALYEGEGVARSKFSRGPVLRHKVNQVPSCWGDKYVFFR